MTVFKQIIDAAMLEGTVEKRLQKWIDTFLAEVAQQNNEDRGVFRTPVSWTRTPVLTPDTIEQLRFPAILVVCPGMVDKPRKFGDGSYEGTYSVGIAALVDGNNELSASILGRRYGAAVRACILQAKDWPEYIQGVEWIDERFTDYLNASNEAMSSATVIFNVTANGLITAKAGPVMPDPLPEPAIPPQEVYVDSPTVGDPSESGDSYTPVTVQPKGGS